MIGRLGAGDAALNALLSRQSGALREEIATRSKELTTGLHADIGAAVGGDFSALAAVDHSLARLQGYSANTTEAGLFAGVMQTALGVISDGAGELARSILSSTGVAGSVGLTAVVNEGGRIFDTAVAALNTRFSERAVFSGVASETVPLPDAATILSALEVATAGAMTAADVKTAIDDWFADPSGYQAAYAGGGPRTPVQIASGETADLPVTALDPVIAETLKGLATVALLGRGVLAGQPAAREALVRSAGDDLLTGGEARAQLMARVGTVEAQISNAETRNSSEKSALSILRVGIVGADPYEAATKLEDLQTRLEALYLITARTSRLSLADYI